MKLHPVKSSNLSKIGYDPETRILEVRFKHGGTYDYENVPPSAYKRLNNAKSKGHALQAIKTKYDVVKV